MVISVEGELIPCEEYEDYEIGINEMMSLESVELWISETGSPDDFPCLAVLLNGDQAVLNIFYKDGSNYVSSGSGSFDEIVPFYDGRYEIHGNQIISKTEAVVAVMDFFNTKDRSYLIDWERIS